MHEETGACVKGFSMMIGDGRAAGEIESSPLSRTRSRRRKREKKEWIKQRQTPVKFRRNLSLTGEERSACIWMNEHAESGLVLSMVLASEHDMNYFQYV